MSFYSLPETLHHEIGSIQEHFFWAGEGDKQKYHMVRWPDVCKPRNQGGLGIMSSKRMNIALLTRWLWRIANGEGGLWLQIIRNKYLRGQPLAFARGREAPNSGNPSSSCSCSSGLGLPSLWEWDQPHYSGSIDGRVNLPLRLASRTCSPSL
uniref:Uncharacterized protein n=1 Tax=Aegilops tauschii subsp. strangulata TaxID=200361 RepID=A0A453N6X2_AEGTS